jgi:hypothetical protein
MMSRAGYSDDGIDDQWAHICWRGAVASAMRGKKGQAFLRELRDALDAMPAKRLIARDLIVRKEVAGADGEAPQPHVEACSLGVVALARGIDDSKIDPYDHDSIHAPFGIANALAREIIYENDESWPRPKTPEERWRKMRWWVEENIKRDGASDVAAAASLV